MAIVMVCGSCACASDEELMARLPMRDIEAFEALYDRYGRLAYSTALRVVADVDLAEDIVQEVFVRIWSRSDRYTPERGRFVTWFLSVVRNKAVDQVRTRRRRQRREVASDEPERLLPSSDDPDPALMAELADLRQTVRRALSSIPAEQRRPIEMAYFGGYTQAEIAAQLSQPLGTVKTRIRMGMQKLRLLLLPEIETLGRRTA